MSAESFSQNECEVLNSIWTEVGLLPPPTPHSTQSSKTRYFLFEDDNQDSSLTQKDKFLPKPTSTMTNPRIGGTKKLGSDDILFSGGGCLSIHRINEPASSLAYRPDTDLRAIMRVEEACTRSLDESKRIDDGSSVITFTQWTNDVNRHFVDNGLDSVAYVLKPKVKGATLPDINDLNEVEKRCFEYNLFTEWGVLTKDDMDSWEKALKTSKCPMDSANSSYARRFLRASVGPVLRERIDRELPIDVSGTRMLFFIIRKLQAVSAISGRQLVDELQAIKLSNVAGCHVQDCAQQIHNVCTKLHGLGASHVPSDLPMLVSQCFDTTGIQAFDLEVTKIENDLDDDPTSHSWSSILDQLTSKFDKLVLTKRWPPLSTEKGKSNSVSGFAVQLEEVKRGLKDVKHALKQGEKEKHDTKRLSEHKNSNVECHYCHKKGHYKTTCPLLIAKQSNVGASNTAKPNTSKEKSEKPKHWTRIPPTDSEPLIKTVMVEGKTIIFKWCKHCRRWRSGSKAHLTDEHKKKGASDQQEGINTFQQTTAGINFGLFAAEMHLDERGAIPGGFLNTFYEFHLPTSSNNEGNYEDSEDNKQTNTEDDDDIKCDVLDIEEEPQRNIVQQGYPNEIAGRW